MKEFDLKLESSHYIGYTQITIYTENEDTEINIPSSAVDEVLKGFKAINPYVNIDDWR